MSLVVTNSESRRYTLELKAFGQWWTVARGSGHNVFRAGNSLALEMSKARLQWLGVLKQYPALVLSDWARSLADEKTLLLRVRDTETGKTWTGSLEISRTLGELTSRAAAH